MTKKAPSEWNLHVKSVFAKGKADKGKGYSFKQALTDAAKTWHGSSAKGKKAHKKQKGGDEDKDEVEMEGGETSTSDEGESSTPMEGGKKSKKSKKRTMKGRKKSRKGKKSRKAKK